MEESLRELTGSAFSLPDTDPKQLSPLTLAYIGDAVYELVIRTVVVRRGNAPVNKLNRKAVKYACAKKQSEMITALKADLTDEERRIYRRGRNATSHTKAKNATTADYRRATGFEALMGYLYLNRETERLVTLVKRGVDRTKEAAKK